VTTREAARSLRRYGERASRAASLTSYTITWDTTPPVPNLTQRFAAERPLWVRPIARLLFHARCRLDLSASLCTWSPD